MSAFTTRDRQLRVLRLLSHLQSGTGWTVRDLAARLDVCRRTVFRDLSLLREAGLDVQFDNQWAGYRLVGPGDRVVAPSLEPDELTTLVAAAHLSVLRDLPECRDVLRRSLNKLLGVSPDRVRHDALRLTGACSARFSAEVYSPSAVRGVQHVLQAIRCRRVLRIHLAAARGGTAVETRFAPYEMLAHAAGWQVTGRSSHHGAVCTLDPRDFQRSEVTDERYAIPRCYPSPTRS